MDKAGALDRRVRVRRLTLGDDGLAVTEVWADAGPVLWASKADVSDAERWRAGEVAAHISARFRVRSDTFTRTITPRDRLVCEGRSYDISGVKEVGRRDLLEITAAARVDL